MDARALECFASPGPADVALSQQAWYDAATAVQSLKTASEASLLQEQEDVYLYAQGICRSTRNQASIRCDAGVDATAWTMSRVAG
jgi:hypothetical protein